jgi:DNA end-binding protein Ku
MGSRSTWNGTISFGLINIPVGLHTSLREQDVSFKQLCPTHAAPIQMKRFCTRGAEEVAFGDLVKGFEIEPGSFVVLTEKDLEHASLPISRSFDIRRFTPESTIDLRLFHTPYFVVPKPGAAKPYTLLREAIRRTGMVGIGTIALKTKQQVAALRVLGNALVLQTIHWPDELVPPDEFTFPQEQLQDAELALAEQLIAGLAGDLESAGFTDEYRANLQQIIEARASGQPDIVFAEAPAREATGVVDLASMLRASLAARAAA